MSVLVGYTSSTGATFNSPNMRQGDFGVLVQLSGTVSTHGVPTWNGVAMTLVVDHSKRPAREGDISIYRTAYPVPLGVTTIARGSGVAVCVVYQVNGVTLSGNPVRSTAVAGGQGQGIIAMSLASVVAKDFLVTANTFDIDDYTGWHVEGVQSVTHSGATGSNDYWVGYAVNQAGTVNVGWDIADSCDGSGAAAAFVGKTHRAGTIFMG